jgi:peptidoglycan/xylan/chitin deacetylase (PgdA/CDA1 family)
MRSIMGTITSVSTKEPVAALTFDDGPHPEFTPHLLEILERHKAHATFFVVGKAAQRQQNIIEHIAGKGHAIGNHSWNHCSFPRINGVERRRQLRSCNEAVFPYGQAIFRPPYGHQSFASRFDAFCLGYRIITWDLVTEDWLDHSAEQMVEVVLRKIHPGSIILFHDALYTVIEHRYSDRDQTLRAVDILLKKLRGKFSFVTVPELLKLGRAVKKNWYMEGSEEWLNGLKEAVA